MVGRAMKKQQNSHGHRRASSASVWSFPVEWEVCQGSLLHHETPTSIWLMPGLSWLVSAPTWTRQWHPRWRLAHFANPRNRAPAQAQTLNQECALGCVNSWCCTRSKRIFILGYQYGSDLGILSAYRAIPPLFRAPSPLVNRSPCRTESWLIACSVLILVAPSPVSASVVVSLERFE